MYKTLRLVALPLILVMSGWACGEETTGPMEEEMGWGAQEQQALLSALNTSGVLVNSPVAGFASMVVGTLADVGSIGAHEVAAINQSVVAGMQYALSSSLSSTYDGAVGVQVGFDIDGTLGWFVGVLGWNGLTDGSSNVSNMVSVYHFDTGTNEPPETHSATIGFDILAQSPPRGDANHHLSIASYWDGSNTYWGTSGSFEVSASSFSGSSDCSQVSFSCSYSTGNMNGSFNFDAEATMGEMTWTQVPVNFSSLPSVKLIISPSL